MYNIAELESTIRTLSKTSKVGDYYNVHLSDESVRVCKLCEFIDNLPVFKTIDNRFLYFDGGKGEFPNRYMGYTEVGNKTMYRRDDILTNLLNETR